MQVVRTPPAIHARGTKVQQQRGGSGGAACSQSPRINPCLVLARRERARCLGCQDVRVLQVCGQACSRQANSGGCIAPRAQALQDGTSRRAQLLGFALGPARGRERANGLPPQGATGVGLQ